MARQTVRVGDAEAHRVSRTETRRPIESIIISIVYFVIGVIITLIAFRFVLLLFGANPDAGFSQLIYTLSEPFMRPFHAVFGTTEIEGAVFEWSALLAIAVYALIGWGIAALVTAVTPRARAGTVETTEEVHEDAESAYPDEHDERGGGTLAPH
jgi:uncharacterized protein YggT (Ycf19 family)